MITNILSVTALILSSCAVFFAVLALRDTHKKSVRAISLRRMLKLEAEMTDMTDAIASMRGSLAKLRSRISMRQLREERGTEQILEYENGEPTDPDDWYKWARRKHLVTQKGK